MAYCCLIAAKTPWSRHSKVVCLTFTFTFNESKYFYNNPHCFFFCWRFSYFIVKIFRRNGDKEETNEENTTAHINGNYTLELNVSNWAKFLIRITQLMKYEYKFWSSHSFSHLSFVCTYDFLCTYWSSNRILNANLHYYKTKNYWAIHNKAHMM